jgi:hypothetical protein
MISSSSLYKFGMDTIQAFLSIQKILDKVIHVAILQYTSCMQGQTCIFTVSH